MDRQGRTVGGRTRRAGRSGCNLLDRIARLWTMAAYGFVSGLPLPLSTFTLRFWLSESGNTRAVIGATAYIGLAYSLKFLWSPALQSGAGAGCDAAFGAAAGLAGDDPAGTGGSDLRPGADQSGRGAGLVDRRRGAGRGFRPARISSSTPGGSKHSASRSKAERWLPMSGVTGSRCWPRVPG